MVIISSLKHNSFKDVSIPSAGQLVAAYGLNRPGSKYSGEEYLSSSLSKVDQAKAVASEVFEQEG